MSRLDSTVPAEVGDDQLCDRFEYLLLAGRAVSPAVFLRQEGVDPAAAGPELLRQLDRLDAYYRASARPEDDR